MIQTKRDYISKLNFDYILKLNLYSKIIRGKYFTKKDFVEGFIKNLTIEECKRIYDSYLKNETPQKISTRLLINKTNDDIIRGSFVQELKRKIKRINNDIVFFEFKVGNKRTDISRINGYSVAYEIKSTRDNLERAISQTKTFLKAFEYVYIIVSEKPDKEKLREFDNRVGFIYWDSINNIFRIIKSTKRNIELNPEIQVNLLRKVELIKYPKFLSSDRKEIINGFDNKEINKAFKDILKKRYRDKWISYYSNSDMIDLYSNKIESFI